MPVFFEGVNSFPLTWPTGWARTDTWKREQSRFAEDRTIALAVDFLLHELSLLGAQNQIISTNLALRRDGLPLSNQRKLQDDPGVAVYFVLKGEPKVLACDHWKTAVENLWAIGKHIEALRGQRRWGVGTIEQAFSGYAALPEPSSNWWEVLGVARLSSLEFIKEAYRDLVKKHHPDAGGDPEMFLRIQKAYEEAQKTG